MVQELSRIPNSQDRFIGRWLLAIATMIFGASNAIAIVNKVCPFINIVNTDSPNNPCSF